MFIVDFVGWCVDFALSCEEVTHVVFLFSSLPSLAKRLVTDMPF